MSTMAALEAVIGRLTMNYATSQSAALCSALVPIAVTGITIYFTLMGFAVLRGAVQDTINTLAWKVLRVALIASLALGGGVYQSYVINGMNSLEGAFAQAMTTNQAQQASSLGQLLDQDVVPLNTLTDKLYAKANQGMFPDPSLLAAAVMCTLGQLVLYGAFLLPVLVAKVSIAIFLAIGPAFILLAMWPATQRFTEAWLAAVLTAELTLVIAEVIANMLPQVLNLYATQVLGNLGSTNFMTDAIGLLGTIFALAWIAWNVEALAARLAGGASLGNPAGMLSRYVVERLAFRPGDARAERNRNSVEGDQ